MAWKQDSMIKNFKSLELNTVATKLLKGLHYNWTPFVDSELQVSLWDYTDSTQGEWLWVHNLLL